MDIARVNAIVDNDDVSPAITGRIDLRGNEPSLRSVTEIALLNRHDDERSA
jgi:hypothetical protein